MKIFVTFLQIFAFLTVVIMVLNANSTVLADWKREHVHVLKYLADTRAQRDEASMKDVLSKLEREFSKGGANVIQSHMFATPKKCKDTVHKVVAEYKRRGVRPEFIMQPVVPGANEELRVEINFSGATDLNIACIKGEAGAKTAYVQFTR